jgi:hypothetical protein
VKVSNKDLLLYKTQLTYSLRRLRFLLKDWHPVVTIG